MSLRITSKRFLNTSRGGGLTNSQQTFPCCPEGHSLEGNTGDRGMVGLDALGDLFQPWWPYQSIKKSTFRGKCLYRSDIQLKKKTTNKTLHPSSGFEQYQKSCSQSLLSLTLTPSVQCKWRMECYGFCTDNFWVKAVLVEELFNATLWDECALKKNS